MKKISFTFADRQAMQVALAVAEEIVNNTMYGGKMGENSKEGIRPILLSIRGAKTDRTFHFEGGTVVVVHLVSRDINPVFGYEDWAVTSVTVRYFETDPRNYLNRSDDKIQEEWDAEKLKLLKEIRNWWHPRIANEFGLLPD